MAKHQVQFQKGYSLMEFLSDDGTEKPCEKALYKGKWPTGFKCPSCGFGACCEIKSRRLHQCKRCHHQTSLTANTIFASTKLNLTLWFLAICLISQSKNGLSALSLKRRLGVSYNTAWMMKHKLMQVMKERDDQKTLEGAIQLDDVYWRGESHGGKVGRGAPNKPPFVAAVEVNEEGHPIAMKFKVAKGYRSTEILTWANQYLASGPVVISDGLACFLAVTEVGCQHFPVVTGGGPASVTMETFAWVNTMIGNVKNAVHGTYHAIAHKHLPRYLAEICYRFNRRFDLNALLPRLAYMAVQTPAMPGRLLKLAEAY